MLALLLSAALAAVPALGSISGDVKDESNGGSLANVEVRAWWYSAAVKGWICTTDQQNPVACIYTNFTNAQGHFSIGGLPPNTYLIDGRGGPPNYTDRWYSGAAADPTLQSTAGYIGSDALQIAVNGVDRLLSPALYLRQGGGLDGTITANGSLFAGLFLRAENANDGRIHHNDRSQIDPHLGEFHFRGLLPGPTDLLSYSLDGLYESQRLSAGLSIAANQNLDSGAHALTAMNLATDTFNGLIDVTTVQPSFGAGRAPHSQFVSSGTLIAPRNAGDVDGFCFQANANDRFELSARAAEIRRGRINPWVDPMLRLNDPSGAQIAFDDDSGSLTPGGGPLDARIANTGELAAGRYCARVTTFGDASFNGTTQGSTGRFVFEVTLLNRRPTLTASVGGQPAPVPPAAVPIVEGGSVTIDVSFADADADPLTVQAVLVDNTGAAVVSQVLPHTSASTASFTWTAPQDASTAGPYTVTFTATDAPVTDSLVSRPVSVNIAVAPVAVPQQVAPPDGSRVTTFTPGLEIQDLVDNTQTAVSYQYELYGAGGALLSQSGVIPQDPSGHMTYVPPPLPENEHVAWRVRALHGATNPAHSAWTGLWHFMVDTQNDPPPAPVLLKPGNGDEVLVRQPGFSASSVEDPEGDGVSLVFELASKADFSALVETSDPVPVTLGSVSTPWTTSKVLDWSGAYWVRAHAVDSRGARSDDSNVVNFTIRPDLPPTTPQLAGPFAAQCQGKVFTVGAPPAVELTHVTDPDNEPVTLEAQVFLFGADPATATPLADVTQAQGAGSTTALDLSLVHWTEDAHYRIRGRAGDGVLWSQWAECDFTVDLIPAPGADGGTSDSGPDGGTADAGQSDGGPITASKSGCSCREGGSPGALLLFLLGAFALRRRPEIRGHHT